LERVHHDRTPIGDRFNGGREVGPIIDARIGLSEPHNGRRTVALLCFGGGLELVYKPRPVTMEAAIERTAAWLTAHDPELAHVAPATLERAGYGYCSFVAPRACVSQAETELFYRRLGALTALLAALHATDCHADNFVARGPSPVLVDAETLLHPRLGSTPTDPLEATEVLAGEVLTSAGQTIVYGGFDAGPVRGLAQNRPAFDAGVRSMRRLLRAELPALLAHAGPLERGLMAQTRLVLRPTEMYARLLGHRLSARSLAAPDRGLSVCARLLRRFEDASIGADAWAAVRDAELAALDRADIPYLLVDAANGDVTDLAGHVLAPAAFAPARVRLGLDPDQEGSSGAPRPLAAG
ncbi:MAG: type 2 lanthipeptide synthetase LanM, partial [Actinomycetota bacterium]|nr:type 2 lanthipeptide synthetase LanM [Actinomycetota bacterium]